MTHAHRLFFSLVAAGLLWGSFWIGRLESEYGDWIRIILTFSITIGVAVTALVLVLRRSRLVTWWFIFVILVAVVSRLLILQATRDLSDDAARYHWDGKVAAHGINPYLYAPDDSEVDHLRTDPLDERINHPSVVTVYPPLAELLFAASYRVTPGSLLGYQLLELLAELAAWLLLLRELIRRRLPGSRLLLIAWIPLAIVEGYLPGHVDLLGLPMLVLLILEAQRRNPIRAGIYFALACLIKPLPLIFLPAIGRQLGWKQTLRFLLVAVLVGGGFYLPFLDAGERLYSSMLLMARQWSFNGSLGALFETLLSMETAHRVSAVVAVVLVLLGTWRGKDLLSNALGLRGLDHLHTDTLSVVSRLGAAVDRPAARPGPHRPRRPGAPNRRSDHPLPRGGGLGARSVGLDHRVRRVLRSAGSGGAAPVGDVWPAARLPF